MPYAQQHYPFEMTNEEFMKGYPADFIAEGLDQTRGWFYTLNIISNAIEKSFGPMGSHTALAKAVGNSLELNPPK